MIVNMYVWYPRFMYVCCSVTSEPYYSTYDTVGWDVLIDGCWRVLRHTTTIIPVTNDNSEQSATSWPTSKLSSLFLSSGCFPATTTKHIQLNLVTRKFGTSCIVGKHFIMLVVSLVKFCPLFFFTVWFATNLNNGHTCCLPNLGFSTTWPSKLLL